MFSRIALLVAVVAATAVLWLIHNAPLDILQQLASRAATA
jgi:hypothetical protein